MSTLPVVAAIPNYNMAESLRGLLPDLLEQEYAGIYVLDDASTDHSRDVVQEFGSDVKFVAGSENLGAGANRNRIIGALGHDSIIHFLDADMQPETDRMPEKAQELITDGIGFVGGLIKTDSGLQHRFNFGPRQSLRNDPTALLQDTIGQMAEKDYDKAQKWQRFFSDILREWPNQFEEPSAERKVFWTVESNMVIPSAVFEGVGGYDASLRDHEVQDLAIRLEELGLERRFSPIISAVHTAVQVRTGNRNLSMLKAELQIHRKHGIRNYFLPPADAPEHIT